MHWTITSDKPVYLQLIELIQAGIIAGDYKPGDRLPSVRELAEEATVNPNTMQRAMTELERTGLVYANRTTGRFITSDESLIRRLREESAKELVCEFLDRMKRMGFDAKEICDLLNGIVSQEK